MYLKVFEKVFEISNTLVMCLITNTNTFFLNVFEILSITLKKVFKYFKYKYSMYSTPSLVQVSTSCTLQYQIYSPKISKILVKCLAKVTPLHTTTNQDPLPNLNILHLMDYEIWIEIYF